MKYPGGKISCLEINSKTSLVHFIMSEKIYVVRTRSLCFSQAISCSQSEEYCLQMNATIHAKKV